MALDLIVPVFLDALFFFKDESWATSQIWDEAQSWLVPLQNVFSVLRFELVTFSIPSGASDNFPINNLSNIAISRKDLSPQDTVEFLTYLIGSDILIVKQDDVSNFGHFKIDSYTVNAAEPAYFNMVLTYIGGNGVLKLEEFYNIVNFVKATDVGDKTFVFDQITPSATWSVTHTLNKFPSVSVVDTAGTQVFTDVNYIDNNNITLTFSTGFAGKAFLN